MLDPEQTFRLIEQAQNGDKTAIGRLRLDDIDFAHMQQVLDRRNRLARRLLQALLPRIFHNRRTRALAHDRCRHFALSEPVDDHLATRILNHKAFDAAHFASGHCQRDFSIYLTLFYDLKAH